jgi:hypothetical protein
MTIPGRGPFFALRPRPARRYPCAGHGDRCAEPGVDGRGAGLRDLRMRALDAIYRVAPVRRVLMQTGLGARR